MLKKLIPSSFHILTPKGLDPLHVKAKIAKSDAAFAWLFSQLSWRMCGITDSKSNIRRSFIVIGSLTSLLPTTFCHHQTTNPLLFSNTIWRTIYCHVLVTVDRYWIVNWIYWITVYNYSYSVSQCTPFTILQ
jgi:hypothetical protein